MFHSHSHSHSHSETHFHSHTESKAHSHCHHHNHDHNSHEDDEFENKYREFFTVVKDSNKKLGSNHDSECSFDHERNNCHHDADHDDHRHDHQHDDQHYHRHHHAEKPNHNHHHNGQYSHHHHHSHVDQYDYNHGHTEPLLERKEKEKHHHQIDHNMRGIFLHILTDTLGSVGVIISTLLIKYKGWLIADPACSIFISTLIVLSVIPLLRNSAEILMQKVPRFCEHELKEALTKVMKLKDMVGVQNLHVWSFTNTDVVGTIHLHVSADSNKTFAKNQVLHNLHDAGVKDLTVQVESVGSNQRNQG